MPLERAPCLGVHQIHERADSQIALQLITFSGREKAILILHDQFMHPDEIHRIEIQPQKSFCGGGRQIIPLRLDHPGKNRRFLPDRSALHDRHDLAPSGR